MKKILILEDNPDAITIYEDLLSDRFQLKVVSSLAQLQAFFDQTIKLDFDLFLADMKLPDGFFLEWIVKTKSNLMEQIPTIIVSSLEDLDVLRSSFEWGATDYLIKPFRQNELIAKIEKAQRDYTAKKNSNKSGSAQELLDELTMVEAKIFQQFLQNQDQFITRDKIVGEVWKKVSVNPKTLDVHLSNLRKKLVHTTWAVDFEHEKGWKLTKKM